MSFYSSHKYEQEVVLDMIIGSANRYRQATGKKCQVIYLSPGMNIALGKEFTSVFGKSAQIDEKLPGVACYAR